VIVDDGLVYDDDKECWVWASKVKPKKNPIDAAHRSAIDINFVFDHYIPNTLKPRLFRWNGEKVNLAEFTIVVKEILGWAGRPGTLYRRLDNCLLTAGIRDVEHAPRRYHSRDPEGYGNYPKEILAFEAQTHPPRS